MRSEIRTIMGDLETLSTYDLRKRAEQFNPFGDYRLASRTALLNLNLRMEVGGSSKLQADEGWDECPNGAAELREESV